MKIMILGSGTMKSGVSRNPAGFLLQEGEERALLDCGAGILRQLKQARIDPLSVNNVFLSHFHLDHCADVFPLLMNRFLLEKDSNGEFSIYGPQGVREWYGAIRSTQGSWLKFCEPNVHEIDGKNLTWQDWQIETRPNGHTENSISYRFEKNGAFFFSSDMAFNPQLTGLAEAADIGFVECSLPDERPVESHMTPSSCARFASQARIKHLVAVHIYPENDTPDLVGRIAEYFSGKISVAEDFMHFDID